jgi:hypothetical protein
MEQSQITQRISKQGAEGARDTSTSGLIGYVTTYYPNAHFFEDKDKKVKELPAEQRHTVDVEVRQGTKSTMYYRVPCFVYGEGLIDHGLQPNDRVWVQFVNGDKGRPIVTAYYREPGSLDLFWNDLKFAIGDFFGSLTGWNG